MSARRGRDAARALFPDGPSSPRWRRSSVRCPNSSPPRRTTGRTAEIREATARTDVAAGLGATRRHAIGDSKNWRCRGPPEPPYAARRRARRGRCAAARSDLLRPVAPRRDEAWPDRSSDDHRQRDIRDEPVVRMHVGNGCQHRRSEQHERHAVALDPHAAISRKRRPWQVRRAARLRRQAEARRQRARQREAEHHRTQVPALPRRRSANSTRTPMPSTNGSDNKDQAYRRQRREDDGTTSRPARWPEQHDDGEDLHDVAATPDEHADPPT